MTQMNPPNYGCAFVHSLLPASDLKAIDDADPSTRTSFCSMMQRYCEQRHSGKDAVRQCVLLSSTGEFTNSLIHSASSLADVEAACCRKDPDHRCFQLPAGRSSCSAAAFSSSDVHTRPPSVKKAHNFAHYYQKKTRTADGTNSPAAPAAKDDSCPPFDPNSLTYDDIQSLLPCQMTQLRSAREAVIDARDEQREKAVEKAQLNMEMTDSKDGFQGVHTQNAIQNGPTS